MKKSFHFPFSSYIAKCNLNLVFPLVIILLVFLPLPSSAWTDMETGDEDKSNEVIIIEESEEIIYTPEELQNIVGFGEDCSSEGPYCDERLHLACDSEEEICMCDGEDGYVHVGDMESSDLLENEDIFDLFSEDNNSGEEVGTGKRICIKATELEYKMDRLLNITKKIKDFANIFRKYRKYLPKKYQDLLKEEL